MKTEPRAVWQFGQIGNLHFARNRRLKYSACLSVLLGLFLMRVLGQLLVAFFKVPFLPPMEEWFSGVMSYPVLVSCQIVIIAIFGRICVDFWRGRGFFVGPKIRSAKPVFNFGLLYLAVMIVRYVTQMGLYPHERWTGGSIPTFFHWVLASFIIVFAMYHLRSKPTTENILRTQPRLGKALSCALWVSISCGILVWLAFLLAPSVVAYSLKMRPSQFAVRVEQRIMHTTDGVALVADVFRPQHIQKTPTILIRLPFYRTLSNLCFKNVLGRLWAERGYTVVIQSTRGRGGSGGNYYPLLCERADGIDTLNWLAKQPWYNGKIATWGGSAFGYTELVVSDRKDPGINAFQIYESSTDFHRMLYPGGAFSLFNALSWMRQSCAEELKAEWPDVEQVISGAIGWPLTKAPERSIGRDVSFFNDWVMHPQRDAYWEAIDGQDRASKFNAPALMMCGWYDPFLPGQLADFSALRHSLNNLVASKSRLLIGPWKHASEVTFADGSKSENFRLKSFAVSLPWFDRILDGCVRQDGSLFHGGDKSEYPIEIFVMGRNIWRQEKEWPLARARQTAHFLRNMATEAGPAGSNMLYSGEVDRITTCCVFDYDPNNPAPTAGGATLGTALAIEQQNEIERRPDVLSFSTASLDKDTEVTGPITVSLFVSTSSPCTDFTAKLVDVHPDGKAFNVTDGISRVHPREGSAIKVFPVQIELWPTSMVFLKGHRIRLEVSSSNFPRFDRNPNTGRTIALETKREVAHQKIFCGKDYPSRIVLPIIPEVQ